jgi:hypothetical protein
MTNPANPPISLVGWKSDISSEKNANVKTIEVTSIGVKSSSK